VAEGGRSLPRVPHVLFLAPSIRSRGITYLIPRDSDGGGSGDLAGAKPDGCYGRGHPQDEHLGKGGRKLPQRRHPKQTGTGAAHFDPRSNTINKRSHNCNDSESSSIQKPDRREDEDDVGEHVHY